MNKPIHDYAQREEALDPCQSFIVQAPAGSGKTELLTQRFLRLLSCVSEPEEILALTFTKKAASEMRFRVCDALKKAQQNPCPEASHEQKTWQLARKALQQDQQKNWELLNNPNRLRIKTIDSFNTLLTRKLPLLSHFGAPPEIIDYPQTLYREATQIFLSHLEENVEWSHAIAQLLLHLDNNLLIAQDLLIEMLRKRDHWLPHIAAYPILREDTDKTTFSLRQVLENNLRAVVEETLHTLKEAFPKDCVAELMTLLQFACSNLEATNAPSMIRQCKHLQALPGTQTQDKLAWLGIAEFLLTKEEAWRKNVDKNIGFPAAQSKSKKTDLNALNKQRMRALIETLSQHEKLHQALIDLLYLPDAQYSEAQWEILTALHTVLKIAAAQLQVIFKATGKIDYTENALAAILALGQEETPTDLALVLDYQLKHILVDEFQDTSNNQFELLKKLVRGWQVGDGRSLFLVGDPMQSIYRFREAEVGLFLRARQQGLGPVSLKPLTLSVNFRSSPSIVEWINTHFHQVLPAFDDVASGAVSYTPSVAGKAGDSSKPAVTLQHFSSHDSTAQTNGIIQVIQQTLASNPGGNIAILVRSRNHLKNLIPALKAAKLPYQAVEIDHLHSRPLIQDLLALTRALLYPADPVAWFSILRAPWCGLKLADLLVLAVDRKQTIIWQRLQQPTVVNQLSPDGQHRLQRVLPVLQNALSERHREDLAVAVEKTWLDLGGPACLEAESDLQDARLFFSLLKKLTQNESSLTLSWSALKEALNELYAQTTPNPDCRIQIMTIHNAKGLEFDTVILPHLEKSSGKSDKPLLTWLERPLVNNTTALLLAPIHAPFEEEDSIYKHIRRQDKNKNQYEQSRLLYVAATRAKSALHICFSLDTTEKGEFKVPAESSMLKKLWSAILNELTPPTASTEHFQNIPENNRCIKRLTTDWVNPLPLKLSPERPLHNKIPGFHLTSANAAVIGTIIHHLLQQMANRGTGWWQSKDLLTQKNYIQFQLIKNGCLSSLIPSAIDKIEKALKNTLQDARGLWLLQKHHEPQAEFSLTAIMEGSPKMLVIDRTFIDEYNQRWIIDYKTSTPEQQDLTAFLEKEKKKYATKMADYQKALAAIENRPTYLGLYFPLIPAWCEWAAE